MSENPRTGLLMATYIEAKPFVEKIEWHRSAEKPFPVYYKDGLILVISGMSKANAAAACAWLCTSESPGRIVNIGAAGANADGLPLGSIHHITESLETDRRHFKTHEPFRRRPDVMDGFSTARLATRDEPVTDPEERRLTAMFAELSDMEGAAVIQTAQKFQTPCYLFKFVSDTPEHTTADEIAVHIRQYRDSVFKFLRQGRAPIIL